MIFYAGQRVLHVESGNQGTVRGSRTLGRMVRAGDVIELAKGATGQALPRFVEIGLPRFVDTQYVNVEFDNGSWSEIRGTALEVLPETPRLFRVK